MRTVTSAWWLPALLGGLAVCAFARPALPSETPPPTAGRSLLDTLWTREELRGAPHDAHITKLAVPDRAAPQDGHIAEPLPPRGPADRTTIRGARPRAGAKLVALTFDLCERIDEVAGYQADIVNYLRDHHVPATFFAGGKWMRSHAEKTMQLMADPLFELGDHSWSHLNLRLQPGEVQEREIEWPLLEYAILRDALVRRARDRHVPEAEIGQIPSAPRLFRFPFGTCTPDALARVANAGLRTVQWDVVTGDPMPTQTADGIVRTVLRGARPGSIVIMHANGRGHGTADALPQLVPALRQRGFEFVTVSDLLNRAVALDTAEECYELHPGDTRKYDRAPTLSGRRTPH